ncbi:MAG: hypothetical protein AMJ46_09180 [Latescibacteria bacterium DG_63]|nr:MAG: hypothetical protein AMJ46_09180 [Latescibacteria bacterium DG_63]
MDWRGESSPIGERAIFRPVFNRLQSGARTNRDCHFWKTKRGELHALRIPSLRRRRNRRASFSLRQKSEGFVMRTAGSEITLHPPASRGRKDRLWQADSNNFRAMSGPPEGKSFLLLCNGLTLLMAAGSYAQGPSAVTTCPSKLSEAFTP